MVRKMFYGYNDISMKTLKDRLKLDASPREVFITLSLLLPMLGIGFYPDLTLQLWNQKAKELTHLSYGTPFQGPASQQSITQVSSYLPVEKIMYLNN